MAIPNPDGAAALPRHLQLLWGLEPAGRRGPRPSRTIQEIGDAAVAIADAEGVGAVSMKRVAESLGLTTMSLYRYVDSKHDLYAVMSDCAAGAPPVRYGPRSAWRRRLQTWGVAIAEVRLAHPWMADVQTGGPPLTPNLVSWMELGVRAFDSTALSYQERFSALLAVDSFVSGHVRTTVQTGLLDGGETPPSGSPAGQASVGLSYLDTLALILDPARFPALTEGAPEALGDGDGEEFFTSELQFGLGILLDGIGALLAKADRRH